MLWVIGAHAVDDAQALAEAWDANCRINRMIIEHVSDDGWLCTLSKRGGRGVAGEFAHVHNIRVAQVEKRAQAHAGSLEKLDASAQPSKQMVLKALDASDVAVRALLLGVLEGAPKHRGFRRGIFTTLSYFISHEAHHRGRVLLTLKVSGETLDRKVQMGIWAWDQV